MSMKTVAPLATVPPLPRASAASWGGLGARIAALVELTKPRVNVLVLLTVAVGFLMGTGGEARPLALVLTLAGTALVGGGACAWNQIIERFRDGRMPRTRWRPLPSGRVGAAEAAIFATVISLGGIGLLALGPHVEAVWVAVATFLIYVVIYTPLKAMTTWNTVIGAIPGALPPVIGWTAATGELGITAWALFLIVFFWQFPHFYSIAWQYRDDYHRGGLKMLPIYDPTGARTSGQAVAYAAVLLPVGLLPALVGLTTPLYGLGAALVGGHYLMRASQFRRDVSDATARRLMFSSFLYLPTILLLLLLTLSPR